MLPLYYEYHNPVKILSGEAALENIPYELHALEAHAPLLLSDQGLKQVGAVDTVLHAMSPMVPKATFTDIPADSSVAVVNQIAAYYKEQGCDSIWPWAAAASLTRQRASGWSSARTPTILNR